MSDKIEARELTEEELNAQIKRIIEINIDPNWSEKEKSRYYAAIHSISKFAVRYSSGSSKYFQIYKDELYKYLKKKNGEVKIDEQTKKEEIMQEKYEKQKQKEQWRKVEEKEKRREAKKKKRIEKIKKFFNSIANFFIRIKNGIVKKLKAGDKKLSLNSGDIDTSIDIKPRDEFIEQLREGIEENQVDEIESQETRINNNDIKNKRKNDERQK